MPVFYPKLMLKKYAAIILSILFLLNSVAVDVINVFAPTKEEIRMKMTEGHEIEFPCQFHNCGCSKTTCFTDCCCKINHEVFNENKEEEDSCCDSTAPKTISQNVPESKAVSIINKMICQKVIPPKNESILLKKELFSLARLVRTNHQLIEKAVPIEFNSVCRLIKTQTTIQPDNPPPNFS